MNSAKWRLGLYFEMEIDRAKPGQTGILKQEKRTNNHSAAVISYKSRIQIWAQCIEE